MLSKKQVLDSFQRLERNFKRRAASLTPGTHGRAQGKTLRLIEDNDGIRANGLAKLLDIRPSSLTVKLDKLEADGNIRRIRDTKDARVVRIYITKEGKDALFARDREKQTISKDFSDCLSQEEKKIFCELCDRLSDNLERMREEELGLREIGIVPMRKPNETEDAELDKKEEDRIG